MYELIFPDEHRGTRVVILLKAADIIPEAIPRIRDAWIEKAGEDNYEIRFVARLGGGNRKDYQEEIIGLRAREGFLRDHDEAFDSTYASFYYAMPRKFYTPGLDEASVPPVDLETVFLAAIAKMQAAQLTPQQIAFGDQLIAALKDEGGSGIIEV